MARNTVGLLFFLLAAACTMSKTCDCGDTDTDMFGPNRMRMIEQDLKGRDITDAAVLRAMQRVPRHLFVDDGMRQEAYNDYPLPIGRGQTISPPYIVALMTQCLGLKKTDRVLEIGTGSGYQAAVLAGLAGEVYTMEIEKDLAANAARRLRDLHYTNVQVRAGDGFFGWPEHAPFDAIILTCSAVSIPGPLLSQLKEDGRIILPLGGPLQVQHLILGIKRGGKVSTSPVVPVRFVPMRGEAEKVK